MQFKKTWKKLFSYIFLLKAIFMILHSSEWFLKEDINIVEIFINRIFEAMLEKWKEVWRLLKLAKLFFLNSYNGDNIKEFFLFSY